MKKFILLCLITFFTLNQLQAAKPGKPKQKSAPHYHYLIYTPDGYDSIQTKNWPLIIYLHGKSAGGSNLNKLKRYGIPFFIDRGMKFNAIVASPQCPSGKNWTTDKWFDPFYKELCSKYHIDSTRIYLTGMSMGGFGTWDLGIKFPNRFATLMPLCGGGKPQEVCAIKDVPVWVFHGDRDAKVPIRRSDEMVKALRQCGGNPRYTVLKGKGHDIHRQFADPALYEWMMQYTNNRSVNKIFQKPQGTDTIVERAVPEIPRKPIRKKLMAPEQNDTLKGKGYMLVF
jgi:predicted peptidase